MASVEDVSVLTEEAAEAGTVPPAEPPSKSAAAPSPRHRYTRRQIWYIAIVGAVIAALGVALVVGLVLGANPKDTSPDASDSSSLPVVTSNEGVGDAGDVEGGDDKATIDANTIATLEPSVSPSQAASGAPSFLPSNHPTHAASDTPSTSPSEGQPTPSPTDANPTNTSNVALSAQSITGGNGTQTNTTNAPTGRPSKIPSGQPSTGSPTKPLTDPPSAKPTSSPSLRPTQQPTASTQAVVSTAPTRKVSPFNVSSWLDALGSLSLGNGQQQEQQEQQEDPNSDATGSSPDLESADVQSASAITPKPTNAPSRAPTTKPTKPPTVKQTTCFTIATYEAIDRDIETLQNNIPDLKTRSHFLGGIVRLVAHDFMDYDRRDAQNPQGPDGCFDASHPGNAGLPGDIWCSNCTLTLLHEEKYAHLSKADFWIAAANAVIRQTSLNNGLDLRDTFVWGRRDANSCPGQGERLPTPAACSDVEDVFLVKMGLTWRDAAALMGAHSLGRGDREFSGHHGTWSSSNAQALIFDKRYYGEMYLNSWRPRNNGDNVAQDFTTGQPSGHPRVMLATDLCLVFDIDNTQCCTYGMFNGREGCLDSAAASRRCPMYSQFHERFEARQAVGEMLGGAYPNDNNEPFYNYYREAWRKATTVGQANLSPLVESCEAM